MSTFSKLGRAWPIAVIGVASVVGVAACGDDSTSTSGAASSLAGAASSIAGAVSSQVSGAVSSAQAAASSALAPSGGSLEGSWKLGAAGFALPLGKAAPTIQFQSGQVSGSAGCNTFNGTYTTDGSKLKLGPLATTKMACGPVETAVENFVLGQLGKVAAYSVKSGTLLLQGDNSIPVLTYTQG